MSVCVCVYPQSGAKASASQPCASDTIEGHVDVFRDVEKAISSRLREIVKAERGSNYSWAKQQWTRIVRRLLGIKPPTRRGGRRPRNSDASQLAFGLDIAYHPSLKAVPTDASMDA